MSMKSSKILPWAGPALLLILFPPARLSADVVETTGGARIVGKVTGIDGGSVVVETDYAGTVTIKQAAVSRVTTDGPVAVRLVSGTRLAGRISDAGNGTLRIAGADGVITTTVDKIAATWTAGDKDPQLVALERHWAFEASVDASGRTGVREQLGTAVALRATLKSAQDTLQFYTAYDRQVADGEKSSDQLKVGTDYQNNFSGKYSWYARDEGGFDRVKDIELYNVAAAGVGYDLVKRPKHTLTGRFGFSFRYEGYKNPATQDVKSAGLDLGFNHEFEFAAAKLVNRLTYVPAFANFANFRLTHESFYEIPLANPVWKLRLGLANDYNSEPGAGVEKLDTSYFTRLVLNWK